MCLKLQTNFSVFKQPKHRMKWLLDAAVTDSTIGKKMDSCMETMELFKI